MRRSLVAVPAATVLAVTGLVVPLPAEALPGSTFVVTSFVDAVDLSPGDGLCLAPGGGCTLRAAVMESNASPGVDTVQLGVGTYELGLSSLGEDTPETGDFDLQEGVTIVGQGAGASVVDGGTPDPNSGPDAPGLARLFEIHPTATGVTFRDLTLRDGFAVDNGGAIMTWSTGLVRLEDVTLRHNLATGAGGAIAIGAAVEYLWPVPDPAHEFLPGGRVEIVNSLLIGNGAGDTGAAIFNQAKGDVSILTSRIIDNPGLMVVDPQDPEKMIPGPGVFPPTGAAITNSGEYEGLGSIQVVDSEVSGNWAESSGAGIANDGDGSIVIEASELSGNTSLAEGGALYTHGGTVTITDSTLADNEANNGGALASDGSSSAIGIRARVTITDSVVRDNVAVASGGGLHTDGDGQVTMTDTTISGNKAGDAGGGLHHGGRAALELVRVTFSGNETHDEGGGAYVGSERLVTINNSTFTDNHAGTPEPPEPVEPPTDPSSVNIAGGGALYTENGPVEIHGSTFTENTSTDEGGAVSIDNHGDVKFTDSLIKNNRAGTDGGGIENSGTRVLFDNLTIAENRAALDGGGIYNSSSGEFTIKDSTVRLNSGLNGGGLANAPDNALRVLSSLFHKNTARAPTFDESGQLVEAGRGGGLWSMADGESHIENTTLSGNVAAVGGGGMFHDADGEIKLSNVTIWRNKAPIGGGIGVVESDFVPEVPPKPNVSVILRNTIVGGSVEGGSCDYYVTSEGGNLDTGRSCFISVIDQDQAQDIRDRRGDPDLDAIADNGGPTLTHMPRYGSLAIDAGNSPCPEFDARGIARPQNGKCDTGAVEFVGAPPPVDTQAPNTQYLSGPIQDSLETVAFEFTGSDNLTPVNELQFECRLVELELTEEPEPIAPWDPIPTELQWRQCSSPWSHPLVEEGLFDFEVRAIDRAGNVDPTPATYHFDGTDQVPPNTIIEQAPPNPTNARTATFTFGVIDNLTPAQFAEYECRLDSFDPDLWLECFNPHVLSNLTSGTHTLEVRAYDGNENVDPTPARYTWTVGLGSAGPVNCDTANIALTASADAWVDEVNPTENYLFETELDVRSAASGNPEAVPPEPLVGENARALVRFAIPSDAPDCTLESAVLKLYSESQTEGRTLEVRPLAGTFKESTVTWFNQPGVVPIAPAQTTAGEGYREFDVTAHVLSMMAGDIPAFGWSVRDAHESDPEGGDQTFASRETPQDPPEQSLPILELTYVADTAPAPAPPTMDPGTVPTEVHCGQVIRQDTIVANDISCAFGEGLVIGAPHIVLDLNGHTIDGPDYLLGNVSGQEDAFPAAVRNSGHTNVIIRNGTLQQMGYGVLLTSGTTRNVVEDLTIRNNAISGVELFDADDGRNGNLVRNNTIVDNELGVSVMAGSQGSTVRDNLIGGNLGEQILVLFSDDNLFEGNTLHGIPTDPQLDSDGGVLFEGSSDNVYRGGQIRDTGDAGITITLGSNGNRVEDAVMFRNGDAGVVIQDSDRTVVDGIVAHQESDGGVVVNNGHDTVIRSSDLRFNPSGVEASGTNDLLVQGNDASNSTQTGFEIGNGVNIRILDNVANTTGGAGISLEGGLFDLLGLPVGGARIEGNTTNQNAESGMVIADGGHEVVDNDAHNNDGFGISIGDNPELPGEPYTHTNLAPPFIDGPMNRASGNLEVSECSGLLCEETATIPLLPIDTSPPDTILLAGPTDVAPALPGITGSPDATFEFTSTDNRTPNTAMVYECRVDFPPDLPPEPEDPEPPEPGQTEAPDAPEGFGWHECSSPMTYRALEQGSHTFQVRSRDQADYYDLTPAQHDWSIDIALEEEGTGNDTVPPDTRIASGPAGESSSTSATFAFSGSDNSTPGLNLTFECRLDGAAWAPCVTPTSFAGLGLGSHTFAVRATDQAPTPNTDPTPATRTWTVTALPTDVTAPDTELTEQPDHTTTLRDATFAFSTDDPTATFECKLDAGAWTDCTSPHQLTGLSANQEHTFLVRAVDPAGNADETPAGLTWFVGGTPTPGFVFCGQVVTHSIVVRNDLIDCLWDGLRVGANNITIDLDGHTIDGKGVAAAIRNDGFDNVTIKNGKVTDFDYGVMLNPGTVGNIVENMQPQNNQEAGIGLGALPHPIDPTLPFPEPAPPSFQSNVIGNILRDNTIDANAVGIWLTNRTTSTQILRNDLHANQEEGIWIERSSNSLVEKNDVTGSSGHAVHLEGASGNSIIENVLNENGGGVLAGPTTTGTVGLPSNDNRIEKNTILESGDAGIELAESHRNQVIQNVAKFANGDGIELYRADENLVKDNDFRANKGGVSLITSSSNRIEGNDASESEGTGISLEALSVSNVLIGNTSNNNDGDGMYVGDETPAGTGIWIENNRTNNNKGYGIYVAKVSHTVKGNIANDNGGWGIWASEGSNGKHNLDGGGNQAQGNLGPLDPITLRPLQCFTIQCHGGSVTQPDPIAPDTLMLETPQNPSSSALQTFRFDGSDNASTVTFQCSLDSGAWAPCTSPLEYSHQELIDLTGHALGNHTIAVRAVDLAGNIDLSPVIYAWTVGEIVTPPAAITITEAPDATTVSTSATFEYSTSGPGAVECALDSVVFTPCTSPKQYAGLALGEHTWTVRYTNPLGGEAIATRTWRITAAPVPSQVACGQIITRSIVLTNDLTNCLGSGLIVGASNITIDLDGHTIDGTGLDSGILNNGFDSVTITGGAVHEFDYGLHLAPGSGNNIVDAMHIELSQEAGVALSDADQGESGSTVRNTTLIGNGVGIGVFAGTRNAHLFGNTLGANQGGGIYVENALNARIHHNEIASSNGPAIMMLGGGQHDVRDNFLLDNAAGILVGEELIGTHNTTIANNHIKNGGGGIVVADSRGVAVLENRIQSTNGAGVEMQLASDGLVRGNNMAGNKDGISIEESHGIRIESNNASDTLGTGIDIGALAYDNVVTGNTASNNGGEGIAVEGAGPFGMANQLVNNTADGNGGDGIYLASAGHVVEDNSASLNGGWGIYAAVGAVDRGGNYAAGNMEPNQCFNVVCEIGAVPGAPETWIVSGPALVTSSRNASFLYNGSDDVNTIQELTFECRIDTTDPFAWEDCEYPAEFLNLSPGLHTVEIRAVDLGLLADPTPAKHTWEYVPLPPNDPPESFIDVKPPAETWLPEAVFTFHSNEPDVTFECKVDLFPYEPCGFETASHMSQGAFEWGLEENEVGPHTFFVRAIDHEGNVGASTTYTWSLLGIVTTFTDGPGFTPGETPLDPPTGGATLETDATISFVANVADATYMCSLDLDPFVPCTSPVTYTDLLPGDHLLRVVASAEGLTEVEAAEYEWEIVDGGDPEPPETSLERVPADLSSSTTFEFVGTDNITPAQLLMYQCRLDSTNELDWHECTSPFNLLDVWTYTEPQLAPGEHTFEVRAVDLSEPFFEIPGNPEFEGNPDPTPATHTWTSVPDTTPPGTGVSIGLPDRIGSETEALVEFFGTDNATPTLSLTFECSLDNVPFEACDSPLSVSGLEPGNHQLRIRTVDLAGNVDLTPAVEDFAVMPAPVTTISSGPAGRVGPGGEQMLPLANTESAVFVFSSDQPGSTFECSLDGAEFLPCASPRAMWVVETGTHEFEVRATNPEGVIEVDPAVYTWTVELGPDVTNPSTGILSGPRAVTTSPDATFTFGGADNRTPTADLEYECALDGAEFNGCTSPQTFTDLTHGEHVLLVRAVDVAGNFDLTPARYDWIIELPPVTTILTGPDEETSSSSATFTFEANTPGSTYQCWLDGLLEDCTSPMSYSGLAHGEHLFAVLATGPGGTVEQQWSEYEWVIGYTEAPITQITARPGLSHESSEPATFEFSTTATGTYFECWLDSNDPLPCTSPQSWTNLAVGQHTFRVQALHPLVMGPAGEFLELLYEPIPSSYTFTVVDTQPADTAIIYGPAATTSSPNAWFGFSASQGGVLVECSLDGGAFGECEAPYQLEDVTPGSHTLRARARDLSGQVDPTPAVHSWTVTVAPHNTPVGNDVTVSIPMPGGGTASANFFEVSAAGATTLGGMTGGPSMPSGYAGARYVDFWSTAEYGEPMRLCLAYNPADYAGQVARLLTFDGTIWIDVTLLNDPLAGTVCAQPEDLGLLAIAHGTGVFPLASITSGPPAVSNSGQATFTFIVDTPDALVLCSIDQLPYEPCTSPKVYTHLEDGDHSFQVQAIGASGTSPIVPPLYEWEVLLPVDTTPPDTQLTVTPGELTASFINWFEFTGTDDQTLAIGLEFECWLDGVDLGGCSTPEDVEVLTAGLHTFQVSAIDELGNVDPSPASFTYRVVDMSPPDTSIDSGPDSETASTSATFTMTGEEETGELVFDFECALDMGDFAPCSSPYTIDGLSHGPHVLWVRAKDLGGTLDPSPDFYEWLIIGEDTTPPDTFIIADPGDFSGPDALFGFASNELVEEFECRIDGGTWQGCEGSFEALGLESGEHTLEVRALDNALEPNVDPTPASHTWTVIGEPETAITVHPAAASASHSATFEFTSDQPTAWFRCSVDGSIPTPCTSPYVAGPLIQDEHTFEVYAGNEWHYIDGEQVIDQTPAEFTWEVRDVAPPETTIVSAVRLNHLDLENPNTLRLELTGSDNGTVWWELRFECSLDGGPWEGCEAPFTYIELEGLAGGEHTMQVRSVDDFENIDPTPDAHHFTLEGEPETTIVTGPLVESDATTAQFTFSTDGAAGTTYECSLDALPFESCSNPATFAVPYGEHELLVRAVGPLGTFDPTPAEYAWVTGDLTPPVLTILTGPALETAETTAEFTFMVDDPEATFTCSLDGGSVVPCFSGQSYTDLAPGPHTFELGAVKPNLLVEAEPAVWEWTVLDVTAPVASIVSGPSAEVALGEPVSFVFTADEFEATFECSLDGAAFAGCSSPYHADLEAGPHTFVVRAVDESLNVGPETAPHEFLVVGPPVTTVSGGPTTGSTTTERTASFTFAADQAGVTFECALDGEFLPCTSPVTYTDLSFGDHTFEVRGTNGFALVEDPAARVDWTVEPLVIGPAPQTDITVFPLDVTTDSSATFEFVADLPATFECKLDAGAFGACTSPQSYSGLGEGEHTFQVRATGTDGAVEDPAETFTWVVDHAPETFIDSVTTPLTEVGATTTADLRSNDPLAEFECALDEDIVEPDLALSSWSSCERQAVFEGLLPGEHRLAVRAVDQAGHADLTPELWTWTVEEPVDTVVTPDFEFTETSTGDIVTEARDATFTFTSNKAGVTFECASDEAADLGSYTPCGSTLSFTGLAALEHSLLVRAVDAAGNRDLTPAEFEWEIGNIPAVVELTSAPPAETADRTATFEFSAPGATAYECLLDTGDWSPCQSGEQYTSVPFGTHTFSVRELDPNALLEPPVTTHTWTVSKPDLPQTTFDNEPPTATTAGTLGAPVVFAFVSNEVDATFECRLDGAAYAPCTSPVELTDLPLGSHTFDVRAVDILGQPDATPATHTWTVANEPVTSVTSGPDVDALNGPDASFVFGSDVAGSTFECSLNAENAWVPCAASHDLTGLADGEYSLLVRAVSPLGLRDQTPEEWSWTVALLPETSILSGPAGRTIETTALFRFSSNEADVAYWCSLDGGPFEECVEVNELVHHQVLVGVGDHTVQVAAEDGDGNRDTTPASYTWTVLPVPETTFGSTPDAETGQTTAQFTFSSAAGNTFECRLDGGTWAGCTSPHDVTGLALGSHSLTVRAVDGDGNVDPTPASYTWVVHEPADTQAPDTALDETPPSFSASTTARFRLTATEIGATFECSLDGAAFAACPPLNDLTGLSLAEHTFAARATDLAGNTDQSPVSYTWTVVAPTETVVDSAPTNGETTSVEFAFSSSAPGATFECRLDGGAWAGCTSPKQYAGLAVGDHSFAVRATSGVGITDTSPATHAWAVLPATVPETTVGSGPSGDTTEATASFTFSSNESGVTFECRLDGGAWTGCTSPHAYTGLGLGQHTFAVRATDGDGNTDASPAERTWTVISAADTVAPETTIGTGPADPTTATSASVTFSGSDNAPGTPTFECRLDQGAWAACTSPVSYSGLAVGLHTVQVRAIDAATNRDQSPAFHQWYVVSSAAPNCGAQQTLVSNADAWLDQNSSTTNKGTDSTLKIQSKTGTNNMRAVVRFPLPATAPAGCVLQSATLRLWNDSPTTGRTIQAIPLAATWTEGGITWANQPAVTGTPATVASGNSKGWREWTVTAQAAAMMSANHGFLIRDSVEGQGSFEQQFYSREKGGTQRPQLVIRFAAAPADAVDPDTTVTSGPSGPTADTSATFGFTSSEPGGTFECSLDGAPYAVCSSGITYDGLAAGAHDFRVRARDLAGNVDDTPGRRDWVVS